MSRKKDDIDAIIQGEKPPPPVSETDNVSSKLYWGTDSRPQNKIPSSANVGDQEVRHRSSGKGRQGLSVEEKIDIDAVCHQIRSVLSVEERADISFRLEEKAAEDEKRINEWRRERGKSPLKFDDHNLLMVRQIAKKIRSV